MRDGKLIAVEVCFGWNLPHKAGRGSTLTKDDLPSPMRSDRQRCA